MLFISVPKSTHTQRDNIAEGHAYQHIASQVARWVKNLPVMAELQETGFHPSLSWEISGGGNDNPLQHSCLDNPMDRGARWATVHGVTKSWIQLSTHTHICVAGDLWGQEKINVKACIDDFKNNY